MKPNETRFRAQGWAAALALSASLAVAGSSSVSEAAPSTPPPELIFVIDNSGSMRANDPKSLLKDALRARVERAGDQMPLGLVIFDAKARVVQPLATAEPEQGRKSLLKGVDAIRYDGRHTNIAAGIERALYELKNDGAEGAFRAILLVTDGIIDTGNAQRDAELRGWLEGQLLTDCRESGVKILGVALTEQADFQLLQVMAQATGGDYFRAEDASEAAAVLERAWAKLSRLVARDAARQVSERAEAMRAQTPPPVVTPPPPVSSPSSWTDSLPMPEALIAALATALGLGLLAVLIAASRRRGTGAGPAAGGLDAGELPTAALLDWTGHSHPIDKAVTTIGRAQSNEIVLNESTISSRHARLEFSDGVFRIEDLRSLNGTHLNGERVEGKTIVRHGDVLRLHEHDCRFLIAGTSSDEGVGEHTLLGGGAMLSDSAARRPCAEHASVMASGQCQSCGEFFCEACLPTHAGAQACCRRCA